MAKYGYRIIIEKYSNANTNLELAEEQKLLLIYN